MENNAGAQTKRKFSAHMFLHFYRNRVMNLLILAAIILYFIYSVSNTVPGEISRCYETMSINLEQVDRYEVYAADANELYYDVQDEENLTVARLYLTYTDYGVDMATIVEVMNEDMAENDAAYYQSEDGTILSSDDKPALTLTDSEKEQLFADGSYQNGSDSLQYYSFEKDNGHLIIRLDESYSRRFDMDMLTLISLNGFIYDNDTLAITEADEDTMPASLSDMYVSDPIETDYFQDSDIQIRLISPKSDGISRFTDLKLAAFQPLSYQNTGYTIAAYIPVSEIFCNILIKSGLPTLLCLAFVFLSIYGSLHFRRLYLKNRENADRQTDDIKLPFNCFISKGLAKHILFMQFFMGLVIIFCSLVLLTLSRFEISYENSKYNLEQLVSTEETCEQALDDCWDVYANFAVTIAKAVQSDLQGIDETTKDDGIAFINSFPDTSFVQKISVYDRDGECEYTTSEGVGYPLSTDPDSVEYQFRQLMNGDEDYLLTDAGTDNGTVYCAMKRTDAVGVIVVIYSDQGFADLKQHLSDDSVCVNFYYRDNCMFVDKDSEMDGTVSAYQITSKGTRKVYDGIDFPVLTKGEYYCGFRTFNGISYLVTGLGTAEQTVLYLVSVSDILSGFLKNLFIYIIFLLIVSLFDFIGCAVYTPETIEGNDSQQEENEKVRHRLMKRLGKRVALKDMIGESQKIIWRHGLYSTICLIILTMLIDALLNRASLLTFLFTGPWEKGANVFAFTIIVFICLGTYLLFKVMRWLFNAVIDNFPPTYAAPLQMIQSILKIVIVVVGIIIAADRLGIDTATILASVGITGLALGIAAKDTINDMLNGIFIILDGRIQVGDYIEINNFYGTVTRIGIRTTKVKYYNMEKSFNNSDMNNVLNYSRGTSCVYLQFKVAPETDLDFLKQLLLDSSPIFNEVCHNALTSDMIFLGSNGFDYQGISCSCFALTEECNRKSYTKKCYQVLVKLLRDNNISFGYDVYKEI